MLVLPADEPLLVLDADLRVKHASPSFHRKFNLDPQETQDRRLYEIDNGQWNIPALRKLLDEVLQSNTYGHRSHDLLLPA
jgi:two-component system CheB/CheR fusion protein